MRTLPRRCNRHFTIVDFENDKRKTQASSILALKVAFENAGLEFLDSTNGGPGVRLKKTD